MSLTAYIKDKFNGTQSWRKLTDGEISLAKTLFQDSINYAAVQLYNRTIQPFGLQDKNRAVAFGNKISFPGTSYSDDFSQNNDPVKRSVFIHELVHVFQQQNDILDTRVEWAYEMVNKKGVYQKAYFYTLSPRKGFAGLRL